MHLNTIVKEHKNGIKSLVGQAFFKLSIKQSKYPFKNRLAYLDFNVIFEFLKQYTKGLHTFFPKNMLILK